MRRISHAVIAVLTVDTSRKSVSEAILIGSTRLTIAVVCRIGVLTILALSRVLRA